MVRKKIKAKKAMLSFHEVESRQVEDFVQCLEDKETNIGPEFMELYEEQAKTNASKTLNLLNNIKDKEDMQHDPLDEMKECSQELLQSSAEADEEMAQCVPELPKTPQRHIQPKKVSRLKENQRPKFKTTPTRKDIENEKLGKQKKMKLCKENNETETKTKKPKISEIADQGGSCFKTKNKEGSWIQCSRVDCLKWRKIPNDIEPTTVADRWVCAMNPDESHMECAASQETCDSQVDYDVVYTPFSAGSLVWAKVPGYPWWPGIVEDDPDYNCCYEIDESEVNPISFHVSFVFDKDVSRSWVSYMSIRSFIGTDNPNETNSKFKKHSKSLLKAITQARSAVDLPINERLKNFSFRALYKGPIGKAKTKKEKDQIHSPSDSQGSQASILFDDKKKSNKVKKTKKPKVSKCSPANSHKSHNGGENAGVQENKEKILKKKKKRKKIILSSADEDDEHEKEGNCETGLGRNMKAAGETDNEAFDHEPKKQKAIKKSVKKKDSPKKTDSVEENPTTGETRHDISQMEIEGTLECKPTNEKEREPGKTVNKDSGKNKLKRKQAKKCKETSQESKQNESICSNAEEEGSVTCSKKQKKKVTDKENKKDAPDMENNGKAKKGKQDNAKGFQTKKTKQTKEEETSGVKSAKIKKKKKILKDGFNSTSILNSSNESSNRSITEDPTVVDSVDDFVIGDKLMSRHSSGDEEDQDDKMTFKDKIILSSTKRMIPEGDTGGKKKTKKMKKENFIASSNKGNRKKTEQDDGRINPEASGNAQDVTDVNSSSTVSQKKVKSGTKKTKSVFGKFKAPVKNNPSVSTSQASAPSCIRSPRKTSKDKKIQGHRGNENKPTPKNLLSDLDNYVSIETLEKDINNLYQELSEGETSSGLLQGTAGKDDEDDNCVTVEFFNNDLTLNVEKNDHDSSRLTNSPEY